MSHPSGFPPSGQGQPPYGPGQPPYGQQPGLGTPPAPPQPGKRRSSPTAWIIAIVAVLVAVGGVVWGLRGQADEVGEGATGLQFVVVEQTSASADEAVRHVVDRLAAGEVNGAYEAFAVNTVAEKWDQVAYLDRVRASGPQDPPNPKDPFFTSSFTLWRLGQIGGQIRYLAFSLTLPEDLTDVLEYRTMPLNDDLTAQQLVDGTTVGNLEGLTVERVEPIALAQSERYQETTAGLKQIYGADEIMEYGVLYSYQGQTWMGGATALRYGDRWLLWSLQSPLINQPVSGALSQATAEEFEDAISDN